MALDLVDTVLSQDSGQNPQPTNGGPDAVDSVLDAATSLPHLDSDPAYQSMQLHVAAMQQNGRDVPDAQKLSILQAYKSLYSQRPMESEGGNSDLRNTLQAQAAGNSSVGNFARAGANAFAQTGANILGIVAPDTANSLASQAQNEYNPDMTTGAGKAGALAGNIVSTLPAVLVPGAALPAFAALGAGGANREVSQRNADGQNIGLGQRALYMGTEAVIQGLVAHVLGNMGGGGISQVEGGELTQAVPLQNLIRNLSPDLLKSIQGTDGAIIRPIIQRTLLNMGIGAGQNEAAMVASEIAKSVEGITGPNDKDLVDRVLEQTPEALVSGAAQALPFALHGELSAPEGTRGPAEEVPQENVQKLGASASETPRIVRYADDSSPFESKPGVPGEPPTEETVPAKALPAASSEGTQSPSEDEAFLKQMQQQLAESNELLSGQRPIKGNGELPANTDLRTGEPEHPLLTMLKDKFPGVQSADIPDKLADDFDTLRQHGIEPVAMKGGPAGFSSADHPDAVAIDVSNPEKSFWNVMAHEAGHVFQAVNPDKASALYDLIPESFKRQARDRYFQLMKAQSGPEAAQTYMAKYGKDEVISMAMGEAAQNDSMVRRAFQKDDSVWGAVKDAFTRTINKFSGRGRMLNAIADQMREGLGLNPGTDSGRKRRERQAVASELPGKRQKRTAF